MSSTPRPPNRPCYLTCTGSFLPGAKIRNDQITDYLGQLPDEQEVMRQVLRMNGIVSRHYAQDTYQNATHDVYDLAAHAIKNCLDAASSNRQPTYLSAGTTHAPLSGPGLGSIIHHRLSEHKRLNYPVEISSHGGICTSSGAAFVSAIRAVWSNDHQCAVCVGADHASEVLKSTQIRPIDDRENHDDLRMSQWFMSVFLRFMLSDGAGAFLLASHPSESGVSLRVDWTHSVSFAHEAPLCMKLDNATGLLSQDVKVLSRYMFELGSRAFAASLDRNGESVDDYTIILPHMSSYFFRRKMERIIAQHCADPTQPVPYWTNLAEVGNTGAASIYVMLDQYLRDHRLSGGERLLLFIPESGQFNYVLVSLTAVKP